MGGGRRVSRTRTALKRRRIRNGRKHLRARKRGQLPAGTEVTTTVMTASKPYRILQTAARAYMTTYKTDGVKRTIWGQAAYPIGRGIMIDVDEYTVSRLNPMGRTTDFFREETRRLLGDPKDQTEYERALSKLDASSREDPQACKSTLDQLVRIFQDVFDLGNSVRSDIVRAIFLITKTSDLDLDVRFSAIKTLLKIADEYKRRDYAKALLTMKSLIVEAIIRNATTSNIDSVHDTKTQKRQVQVLRALYHFYTNGTMPSYKLFRDVEAAVNALYRETITGSPISP